MSWWLSHNFEAKKPYLEARMRLIKAVRGHFDGQGFWEVETPILQVCPVMDTHIHGFKTQLYSCHSERSEESGAIKQPDPSGASHLQDDNKREMYLHTSPEFAMKKLMVAGVERLYQICHVFRNGEDSKLHSPEFTMIEWYRAQAGYREIMEDCQALLRHVAESLGIEAYAYGAHRADPFLKWNMISIAEAFDKYVEIDICEYLEDVDGFRAAIAGKGIRVAEDDRWDDLFFRVMAEKIEPYLGMGAPTILYDYPVCMASLARRKPEDPRFAERFELYVCGVELGNGFGELTDAAEQRARFEAEMALKKDIYGETYPLDEDFIKALEHGLPESGGIALGLDRLAMLACGVDNIEDVLWTGRV